MAANLGSRDRSKSAVVSQVLVLPAMPGRNVDLPNEPSLGRLLTTVIASKVSRHSEPTAAV
jgi:hypothetical protein